MSAVGVMAQQHAVSSLSSRDTAIRQIPNISTDQVLTSTILAFPGLSKCDPRIPAIPGIPANPCSTPPDGGTVAAGFRYVVEVANLEYAIYDKTKPANLLAGTFVTANTLASLFLTGTDSLTDPRVIFDSNNNRFFMTVEDQTTLSVLLIVLLGNNPSMVTRSLNLGPGGLGGCWGPNFFIGCLAPACPDQPIIGDSSDKIVIRANDYPGACGASQSPLGGEVRILDKRQVLSGIPPSRMNLNIYGPGGSTGDDLFSAFPVQSETQSDAYAVDSGSQDIIATAHFFVFSGKPPNAAEIETGFDLSHNDEPSPFGNQPGLPGSIITSRACMCDQSVLSAAFNPIPSSNPTIYFAFNRGCQPDGNSVTEACFEVAQISTTGPGGCLPATCDVSTLQDFGFGLPFTSVYYPALDVDSVGDLVVVYGFSSSTVFPSLAVAGELAGGPPNSLVDGNVIAKGTGTTPVSTTCLPPFGCISTTRYGDYFSAARDPSNGGFVWVGGEFCCVNGDWGTEIAQEIVFNSIDYPGASNTAVFNTNANTESPRQTVGIYSDNSGTFGTAFGLDSHGFLFSGGAFSTIPLDPPGAALTSLFDINDQGQMVGTYTNAPGCAFPAQSGCKFHGFLLSSPVGGTFTTIDFPGAVSTVIGSINSNNPGQMAGWYVGTDGVSHAIVGVPGGFTTIDPPNTLETPSGGAFAEKINNIGTVVGQYTDASGITHGFVLASGVYTTIDAPGATLTTLFGINDKGQIVGESNIGSFYLSRGVFTAIVFPGSVITDVEGINNLGQISGVYYDTFGIAHGFLTG